MFRNRIDLHASKNSLSDITMTCGIAAVLVTIDSVTENSILFFENVDNGVHNDLNKYARFS